MSLDLPSSAEPAAPPPSVDPDAPAPAAEPAASPLDPGAVPPAGAPDALAPPLDPGAVPPATEPAAAASPLDPGAVPPAAEPGAFASLAELRSVQARLGERRRLEADTAAFWDAVAGFVQRGAATGVVIDNDDERWTVQGQLDYWATALERAGRSRVDSSLAEFDPELAPELPDEACPYLGLSAFRAEDSRVFFGRDELVDKLVRQLAEHRLIAVVGPSGSGKSSLVLAGLVGRLRAGALPGSETWHVLPPITPGTDPGTALAGLFAEHMGRDQIDGAPVVVVIDQFEELFTLCKSDIQRTGFLATLVALTTSPVANRVVVTMRSDFEGFVARHDALYARYTAGRVAVTPPSAVELRQAIERPAELVGLKFEAGVIDRLLQELLGEPAGLPLLQFTLRRLWEERHRNRVPIARYERVGGGRQALARAADAVYDAMIPQDQATARRILLLVGLAVDARHELTRTRVPRSRFFEAGEDPGRVERVLDRLIAARLLRQSVGPLGAEPQVEVAHEALVRNWPRLTEWLQDAEAGLAERRRLEAKAAEWVRLGKNRRMLFASVELRDAERWRDSSTGESLGASDDLIELLAASRQQVEAAARRRGAALIGLIGLAVLLAAMLVVTVRARGDERARRTETQRLLMMSNLEQGRSLLVEGHPTRALPYLVEARRALGNSPVLQMLFGEAVRSLPLVTFRGHTARVVRAAFSPDSRYVITASDDGTAQIWDATSGEPLISPLPHRGPVEFAAFSPDGRWVITGSREPIARVWEVATGTLRTKLVHRDSVLTAEFSADGRYVVTTSADRTASLWNVEEWSRLFGDQHPSRDAATGKDIPPADDHIAVLAAAFAGTGEYVITANADDTIQKLDRHGRDSTPPLALHRVETALSPDGQRVVTANGNSAQIRGTDSSHTNVLPLDHRGPVNTVSFSPDGCCVVTASADHTARIWNASSGMPLHTFEHHAAVNWAAFSRDGKRVVTASADGTARVWDVETGNHLTPPLLHATAVERAIFNADGTRVTTLATDGWMETWYVASATPPDPRSYLTAASFSPDGKRLVTVSADNTVRVWDVQTSGALSPPLVHEGAVHAATLSRDGRRLVIASGNAARVWDVETGKPLTPPLVHDGVVHSAMFSPDGWRVLTASADNTARVWSVLTGEPLSAPLEHPSDVLFAAFSPNGLRVVTVSADKTARVWRYTSGRPDIMSVGDSIESVAFSPDSLHAITAGRDGTARIWDAEIGKLESASLIHERAVRAAAFSPDGTRVVTASEDGTARIWRFATGQPLSAPLIHDGAVIVAAFSPDGTRVITASEDRTARIWNATTGRPEIPPLKHQGVVRAAAFSPDGTRVVTASDDNTARVWRVSTGDVGRPLQHRKAVLAAVFSPDGTRIVTASEDRTGRVWNADSGAALTPELVHSGPVRSAAFSPDGTRVITASDDSTARIWDATTGNPLTPPLEHQGTIAKAVFSPDGTRVVTASHDRTVRIWDADTGKPLLSPILHRGKVHTAVFSPDGTRVLTASDEPKAEIWTLAIGGGTLDDWIAIARCAPFALVNGVLVANVAAQCAPTTPDLEAP